LFRLHASTAWAMQNAVLLARELVIANLTLLVALDELFELRVPRLVGRMVRP